MNDAAVHSNQDSQSPVIFRNLRDERRALTRVDTVRRWLRRPYGLLQLLGALDSAKKLRRANPGSSLFELVASTPHLSDLAARPFVSAGWNCRTRLARMIDHCTVVDRLGHPFNLLTRQYFEVMSFALGDNQCRLMLDRPAWLECDGLLTTTLWVGIDRIFSISFCLSDAGGLRTAYVGGIQGRRHSSSLEQNRSLTKAANGLRPSDLAFELFRMMLPRLGIDALKCVSNSHRYQKTRRALMTISNDDQVLLDYDALWTGRGGISSHEGFFDVPVRRTDRDADDIPARKRSMYEKRYALLRTLEVAIIAGLNSPVPASLHRT